MAQHSIFVSHAHADNALCDRYVAALRARGLDVWYDRTNLGGGRALSAEIQRELQARSAFVVMLSPSSVDSYWVALETDAYRDIAAHDASRLMLPVRIARCEVPLLLRGLKWIDASTMTFERALDEIAAALGGPGHSHHSAARQVPTPMPTQPKRRPALRHGLLFGGAIGALALISSIIQPATQAAGTATNIVIGIGCSFYLAYLALFFVAGLLAARETGTAKQGSNAAMIAGLVGSVLMLVLVVMQVLLMSDAALAAEAARQARGGGSASSTAELRSLHLVLGAIGSVITGFVMVWLAAGLGALGGLVGKRHYQRSPMAQH